MNRPVDETMTSSRVTKRLYVDSQVQTERKMYYEESRNPTQTDASPIEQELPQMFQEDQVATLIMTKNSKSQQLQIPIAAENIGTFESRQAIGTFDRKAMIETNSPR